MALKEFFYDWNGLNVTIFKEINAISGNSYDAMMILISQLSDYHNFPYYLIGLLFLALLSYISRKIFRRGGAKQALASWIGVFVVMIIGFGANGVMIRGLKEHASFPRPYVAIQDTNVRVLANRNQHEDGDNYRSFPSGHTAFATFLVIALWPVIPQGAGWLALLVIPAVCWSRIAMGMHFPADVLGSVLMTSILILTLRSIIYSLMLKILKLRC